MNYGRARLQEQRLQHMDVTFSLFYGTFLPIGVRLPHFITRAENQPAVRRRRRYSEDTLPKPDGLPDLPHNIEVTLDVVNATRASKTGFRPPETRCRKISPRMVSPAGVRQPQRASIDRIFVFLVTGVLHDHPAFEAREYRQPFRALRVGRTQSIMSIPRATYCANSSGIPTPIA